MRLFQITCWLCPYTHLPRGHSVYAPAVPQQRSRCQSKLLESNTVNQDYRTLLLAPCPKLLSPAQQSRCVLPQCRWWSGLLLLIVKIKPLRLHSLHMIVLVEALNYEMLWQQQAVYIMLPLQRGQHWQQQPQLVLTGALLACDTGHEHSEGWLVY